MDQQAAAEGSLTNEAHLAENTEPLFAVNISAVQAFYLAAVSLLIVLRVYNPRRLGISFRIRSSPRSRIPQRDALLRREIR